ncbi:hypothetical protein NQ318_014176 [Aromia moschata]|uniref:Coiled-coil domain-containing protein 86 n=1 Tax=Aromia moschata TaxID=1265417 RepID=A0AAV8YAE2_9CUCU|nr:hypothetical protein NQ318_014176 [Aromia moschata]
MTELSDVKVVTMEDILINETEQSVDHKEKQNKIKEKKISDKKKPVVPKGKPKSGRVWKSQKTNTFAKKQALREELKRVKEASNAIKAAKQEEKELKKQRRRDNLKRQEENRKKSEIVQVITNTKKLKRIKKKHLRNIEKRDTTVVSK